MADSNDELLEDGDLSETNFEELDLAEEDALLADDVDEKPLKSIHNEGEKTTQEDDDYLELGVDEDLNLNDEEVLENGSNLKKREPIDFNSNDNDDSDDNSGGERTRFKSERQIIARSSSAIPETLDAVAVRNPVKFNRGGHRGGKNGRTGNNRKFFRNQPTNIHVNPHFRPRGPLGGPQMWNGGFQGPPQPQYQPPHPPFGYQPPVQQPPWNDQGYYMPPGPPAFNAPMDNNFYGPSQDYYPHQNMQPGYPSQPPPPQPQMGWGDPNFYQGGPPQNFPPHHFQHGPVPQMLPPRMRPPFNPGPRPPFHKNQNKHFVAKHQHQGNQQNWSGNVRPQKRDQFHHIGKAPPTKQQRFENTSVHRVRSNLQEVKMVDSLPADVLADEEDEEMKAYRKKIEEQKKLREQLLKQKEENRMVAAQQKLQESARLGLKGTAVASTLVVTSGDGPPGVNEDKKVECKVVRVRTPDGKTVLKKMTLEEIKKLKKIPPTISKGTSLINSNEAPSCVVSVENLSASTTQKQLEDMASQVGPVEKLELDSDKKTAIIRFLRLDSAKDFVSKYQRKMVDLSMIGVKFVKQE